MKKGKKAYVIRDWSKGEIKEFMDLVDKSDGVGVLLSVKDAREVVRLLKDMRG